MSNFDCLNASQLAALSSVLAIKLSDGLSNNDINVLGNFMVATGSVMLTIAAQQQSLQAAIDNQNIKTP